MIAGRHCRPDSASDTQSRGFSGLIGSCRRVWSTQKEAHLVILLHEELQVALAGVALAEGGIEGDAFLGILQALIPGAQLGVAGCPVAEELVRLLVHRRRAPLQGLCVVRMRLIVLLQLECLRMGSKTSCTKRRRLSCQRAISTHMNS